MPAKKTAKSKAASTPEGDRVNASMAASRAAGETVLVELTRAELDALNHGLASQEHGSAINRPGLTPAG